MKTQVLVALALTLHTAYSFAIPSINTLKNLTIAQAQLPMSTVIPGSTWTLLWFAFQHQLAFTNKQSYSTAGLTSTQTTVSIGGNSILAGETIYNNSFTFSNKTWVQTTDTNLVSISYLSTCAVGQAYISSATLTSGHIIIEGLGYSLDLDDSTYNFVALNFGPLCLLGLLNYTGYAVDSSGALWMANFTVDKTLGTVTSAWSPYSQALPAGVTKVISFSADALNGMYIVGDDNKLYYSDGGSAFVQKIKSYSPPKGFVTPLVKEVVVTIEGSVWVSVDVSSKPKKKKGVVVPTKYETILFQYAAWKNQIKVPSSNPVAGVFSQISALDIFYVGFIAASGDYYQTDLMSINQKLLAKASTYLASMLSSL